MYMYSLLHGTYPIIMIVSWYTFIGTLNLYSYHIRTDADTFYDFLGSFGDFQTFPMLSTNLK